MTREKGGDGVRYSAAFLDRDGTIIRDHDYVDDPADVELIPRSSEAIARLNARGIPVIVVTNQSGIGRGYYTEAQFRSVQEQLERELAVRGCAVDGVYFCPHDPDRDPPCECRKPGLGLYREAAERFGISLSEALYVGDKPSDVLPGVELGGDAYLVETGRALGDARLPEECARAADLWEAVEEALGAVADE